MVKLSRLFSSKADPGPVEWSDPNDPLHPMHRGNRQLPFMNYLLFTNSPVWQELKGFKALFHSYHHNPIHNAVVNIKAREYANMNVGVWNKRLGIIEPRTSKKPQVMKLYKLMDKPNLTQSRWEFFQQWKINLEVSGNSFVYGNASLGFKPTWENINTMWNVWPERMKYKLGGKYFEATKLEEIIAGWKFEYGGYKKEWSPYEVMHKNRPNTDLQQGLIFGQSAAVPLYRPLSNIQMAYESRNVLMRNRGMRAILSSDQKDATGKIPLQEFEKLEVEQAMRKYGMLEGQEQFLFTSAPITVTSFDQDVFKLGLFEEIATDTMIVAIAHGVPEVLVKLYVKGTTFENQEASVRRLYQGALIPESLDDMMAFSSWLGLDETDFCLIPLYDHVVALQESEERKANVDQKNKQTAMQEVAAGLRTKQEYRDMFEMGPMPEDVEEEVEEETTDEEEKSKRLRIYKRQQAYVEKYLRSELELRYGKAA